MKLNRILGAFVGLLAVAFLVQLAVVSHQTPEVRMVAAWASSPDTMEEAMGSADQIIVGKVTGVRRADDIVIKAPGEPNDEVRIPAEVVTIKLEKSCKGGKPERVQVFHTGLSIGDPVTDRTRPPGKPDEPPNEKEVQRGKPGENDSRTVLLDDDPAYNSGDRVVLFLTDGPKVTVKGKSVEVMRVISPEGRYQIKADGKVEPATERKFAGQFKGKDQGELERSVGGCEKA